MQIQKQDRRIRRTKKMIKEALIELMEEREFQNISVRDITERADLNRGTFYLHYSDTYDLLEKMEDETIYEFQQVLDTYKSKTSTETLLPMIDPLADYILENERFCRIMFNNKASSNFLAKFQDFVFKNGALLVSERFNKINIETYEYYFSFITYGLIGVIKQWFDTDMKLAKKDLVIMIDKVITGASNVLK